MKNKDQTKLTKSEFFLWSLFFAITFAIGIEVGNIGANLVELGLDQAIEYLENKNNK